MMFVEILTFARQSTRPAKGQLDLVAALGESEKLEMLTESRLS